MGILMGTPAKTKEVCHDMTGVRKIRREALRHQAFLDRDYSYRYKRRKLFNVYLDDDKKPLFYVQQRKNQRRRKKVMR